MRNPGKREASRNQDEQGAILGGFHGDTQNSRRFYYPRKRVGKKKIATTEFL
jgi:hypothetical protein